MRRRNFISIVGGAAAAWPLSLAAQQLAMSSIGFLGATSPDTIPDYLRIFREVLKENGFIEGENISIEYRWAENRLDRLPALAADLVRRKVSVIVTIQGPTVARAVKEATAAIPIVFMVSDDPVRLGLVASLARPGGNLTGINFISGELGAKRLELLRELMPQAARIAVLINPADAAFTEATLRDLHPAARIIGLQIQVFNADTSREIDAAFAAIGRERWDAVFVPSSPLFTSRRVQLVQLAARYAIPVIYPGRQYADHGGLMTYGANIGNAFRQSALYVSRILKGSRPAEMPVVQAEKFELVINAQTARMLGLTIPSSLLARADEILE